MSRTAQKSHVYKPINGWRLGWVSILKTSMQIWTVHSNTSKSIFKIDPQPPPAREWGQVNVTFSFLIWIFYLIVIKYSFVN